MESILLLTDFYLPNPSANGICIKKLAEEYVNKGYNVSVVAYGIGDVIVDEIIDNVKVYRIKAPKFYRIREKNNAGKYLQIMRLLRYLRIIVHAFQYPLIYPHFAFKYKRKVNEVIKKENVTKIVAEYIPIESVWSAMKLKKKYGNIKVNAYIVDTFTQGINEISHPFFGWTSSIFERKLLENIDNFFCMPNFKSYYEGTRFTEYRNKIKFVGLPLIQDNCVDFYSDTKDIKLMYTGSWGGERNPSRIMEVIEKINKKGGNIRFIYCGKPNDVTEKIDEKYTFFEDLGFRSEGEIKKIAKGVSYLVNIGNSTNMLPSKLFSYMSYGIPIMHFYITDNDPCINYIQSYKYSLCFDLKNFSLQDFETRIEEFSGKRVNYEEIEDFYIEFTPKYIAKTLISDFEWE